MDRRSFLRGAATTAAAIPFGAFVARTEAKGRRVLSRGYGALQPVADWTTGLPLLLLPKGFSYLSFGWTGDKLASGVATPGAHDGMAAFPGRGRVIHLVRNHEIGALAAGAAPFGTQSVYDMAGGGGTTTLEFDTKRGRLIQARDSLAGTRTNCAGGPTPWGSWLTCEETTFFEPTTGTPHGYIFEVPADSWGKPEPLRDMGRFSHEAVAVDRVTGYVYETEDAGTSSGFYRFIPNRRRRLSEGGRLSMLKVKDVHQAPLNGSFPNGTTFDVEWVDIDTPDNPSPTMPNNFVWSQGRAQGAATFARLEGCWYGNDRKIYVVSTNGGIGQGQVWEYDPRLEKITLLFESPGSTVLNAPDNITVSPRGGLVLCEDGDGDEFLHGLTVDGEIFQFAKNNTILNGQRNGLTGDFRSSEFAGACYSPDGDWLFVNIQTPGITLAITGPWEKGAL